MLADFDGAFVYPPGPQGNRILHGDRYLKHLAGLGESEAFFAERDRSIRGVTGAAIRRCFSPDGTEAPVLQVVDFRIRQDEEDEVARRLAQAVQLWGYAKAHAAFAVAPEEETEDPAMYARRASIPAFRPLAKIVILKLPCPEQAAPVTRWIAPAADVERCFLDSVLGRFAVPAGGATARSKMRPVGLVAPDRAACGLVEDTRAVRRVVRPDGRERTWAHLSNFTFREPKAGAELVRLALQAAAAGGCSSLCVSVPEKDARKLAEAMGVSRIAAIPATVHGTLLDLSPAWHVSSAEV